MPEDPRGEVTDTRPVCYHVTISVGDGTFVGWEVPHEDPRFEILAQAVRERGQWAGTSFDGGSRGPLHQFDMTYQLRDPTVEVIEYNDGGAGFTDEDITRFRREAPAEKGR